MQFRISGDDLWQLRGFAEQIADVMRANPYLVNVHLDWNERSKTIRLNVDNAKAISLGVTQSTLSQLLQSACKALRLANSAKKIKPSPFYCVVLTKNGI